MAIKILPFFAIVLAFVLVAQAASSEVNVLPEIVFIENPDTFPARLSPQEALLAPAQRNRVCTAVLCARVCAALGFRLSRCNANRVCVCRN